MERPLLSKSISIESKSANVLTVAVFGAATFNSNKFSIVIFKTSQNLTIISVGGSLYPLVYIYFNEPRAEIQDRSAIHYGTAMLKISKHKELTGNYYTGRNSKGSMKFLPDVN